MDMNNKSDKSEIEGLWDGEEYNKNSGIQYKGAMGLLDKFNFKGNEKVLDIACGDGKITKYISKKVPDGSIVGIDQSTNMINYANKMNSGKNMSFKVECVENIKYNEEFDIIFSSFCFHFVPNKELVAKLMHKALKPGGTILFIVTLPGREYFAEVRRQLMNENYWKFHFENYMGPIILPSSKHEYESSIKNADLSIISSELEILTYDLENLIKVQEFIKSVTPQLSALKNLRLQDEFMEQVMNGYLGIKQKHGEHPTVLNYDVLSIIAKKVYV